MNFDYLNLKDNTMKDLFFIVKGQRRIDYRDKDNDLLGYDPTDPNTHEWYMLVDNKTFSCVACSSDLQKVLQSAYRIIKLYRGISKRYFDKVLSLESQTSTRTREVYRKIYEVYGDHYCEDIKIMEDLAYSELVQDTPVKRNQKLIGNALSCEVVAPKKGVTITTEKKIMPKKIGKLMIRK